MESKLAKKEFTFPISLAGMIFETMDRGTIMAALAKIATVGPKRATRYQVNLQDNHVNCNLYLCTDGTKWTYINTS